VTTATTVHPAHDGQVARDVLLLGATGNSGQLIEAELVERGMSVRLAGRRPGPLEDLARALDAVGGMSDVRVVDAGDAVSLVAAIAGVGWSCPSSGRSPGWPDR
jgi:uncharacterized protein YbjT (DUF2867 family)